MAETIIKVNGDSEGAVKALDAAAKSIAGLDASVDSLNEEMTATGRSTASFTAGQAQIQRAAQATQQKMQSAAGALGQLGGALGQVSPAAGAAGSAMSAFGSAVGSLPSLLTPATAAMAAITLAVTAGVAVWKKHQEEIKQNTIAMEKARKEAADLAASIQKVVSQQILTDFATLTGAIDGLGDAIASINKEAALFNREIIESNAADEAARLKTVYESSTAVLGSLTKELEEQERVLARMEGPERYLTTNKEIKNQKDVIDRLNNSIRALTPAIESHWDAWQKAEQAQRDYQQGVEALANKPPAGAPAPTAARDWDKVADSMLRAATASGDFSKINESLGKDGELSRRLTDLLSGFDQGFLLEIGVDTTTLTENINRAKTGMDVLSEEAREFAEYNERALEAIKKAGDEEFRRSTAILEQNEWYRMLTMSSAEKAEYDKEQLRIAYELLEANQELTAEQRRRIEEAQAASAKPSGNTSGGAETELSKIDKMNEKLTSFGTSVEGIASGVMGDLTNSIIGAVTEGEKLGEALPQAFLKSIGGMAAQMAAMSAGQALMMTFTPGMQGNAAGLWAASGALTAVAIGAGVAVKAVGKRGKGSSGSTAQESTGGGTNVFIEDSRNSNAYAQSGMRARDYGAAQSNADRLNIDRGRSWA